MAAQINLEKIHRIYSQLWKCLQVLSLVYIKYFSIPYTLQFLLCYGGLRKPVLKCVGPITIQFLLQILLSPESRVLSEDVSLSDYFWTFYAKIA